MVEEATKAAGRVFTKEQIRIVKEVLGAAAGSTTSGTATVNNDGTLTTSSGGGAKSKSKGAGKGKGRSKGKSEALPPGLAKKDNLPPGLQKQLEKGGSLPPGLAKRELPYDLAARLGAPATGTERVIIDNDVVLVEKGTEIVLDVIRDALGGGIAKQ